jgi:hypothetical protein
MKQFDNAVLATIQKARYVDIDESHPVEVQYNSRLITLQLSPSIHQHAPIATDRSS